VKKFVSWCCVAVIIVFAGCGRDGSTPVAEAPSAEALQQEREQLDATLWAHEVEAGRYEQTVIALWDAIRTSTNKLEVLRAFEMGTVVIPRTVATNTVLDLDVQMETFTGGETLDREAWLAFMADFGKDGWTLVQSDWHHGRFVPANGSTPARSEIDFNLHAIEPRTRTVAMVEALAEVEWVKPLRVVVTSLKVKRRSAKGAFRNVFSTEGKSGEFATAHPLMVYDLNGDGASEIALPRWNRVYWNRGGGSFFEAPLLKHPVPVDEAAVFSDFDGDSRADLLIVGKVDGLLLYRGGEGGMFTNTAEACAKGVDFQLPSSMTAGDVDGDGDLDVWITQYKLAYYGGQMPTPYYDANDGWPSMLLINDGSGRFHDETKERGLGRYQHRRTYSASLVDIDDDGDLDLVNVADYAGLDLYRNDGQGHFVEITDDMVDNQNAFGMAHAIADYNADGRLDLYVTGMSSTTARRLDRLGLGRADSPQIHEMRQAMGYGNRMYFGGENTFSEQETIAAAVARTGWTYGVVAADFDLDGDRDLYVANGFRSGRSTRDYCTTFWRHDIYSGGSAENEALDACFRETLLPVQTGEISWNGYEKNRLLLNNKGVSKRFEDAGFILGVGVSFDARAVVADDLDGDGRMDIIMSQVWWDGKGWAMAFHIYRNELALPEGTRWAGLKVGEAGPGKSPNGAVVDLVLKDGRRLRHWIVTGDSFSAQHAPAAHFGIPAGADVDKFEVKWPNGDVQHVPATVGAWRKL
jgi:hypothetical protein